MFDSTTFCRLPIRTKGNQIRLVHHQPFRGRTEEEVFEERARILSRVETIYKEEFSVIDQYHQIAPEGAGRFYYLSQDILMMDKADLIAFSPD